MTAALALVTCRDLPKADLDEGALTAALAARGVTHDLVVWDDPDVDWAAYRAVLLRTPWDYPHRLEEFVPWTKRAGAVAPLLNSAAVVAWNHHKRYLFDLAAAGLPVVPTQMLAEGSPFAFQRAAIRRFDGEVVVKPAVGIGAFGAGRVEAGTEEAFAHAEALCLLGDTLVQPFVPSIETEGEVSVIVIGGEVTHAVRKVPTAGDYRVQDHHGGTVVDHEPTAAERAVALEAVTAAISETAAPVTYARVDLVDLAGPTITELELIEPELFLRRSPRGAEALAAAVGQVIDGA